MKLYDAMKDAEAALKTAQLCGSGANGAQAALNAATKAFQDAFDEYVVGWSQNGPHLADYLRNHAYLHKSGRDYQEDARKLLDELARQDKKQHLVGACLPAPGATTPPTDGATPLGPCTTMSQAEIDAAIEKATNQLLNAMRWLRKFDDAVIRDIAAINSWNSRMGKAGDDRLSELKANLKRDSFGLDVITRERDDDVQKLRALKALKPCPAGAQPTPQSDKPQTPPAKPKSDSDADERPEIGALPPARKDSGFLGEVLGHVSFGFGIGGGRSDHGHRPISSRTPEIRTMPRRYLATAARRIECPIRNSVR